MNVEERMNRSVNEFWQRNMGRFPVKILLPPDQFHAWVSGMSPSRLPFAFGVGDPDRPRFRGIPVRASDARTDITLLGESVDLDAFVTAFNSGDTEVLESLQGFLRDVYRETFREYAPGNSIFEQTAQLIHRGHRYRLVIGMKDGKTTLAARDEGPAYAPSSLESSTRDAPPG